MNPGIQSDGLFWTMPIPEQSIDVDLEDGRASMRLKNAVVTDYGNINNALFGGGPAPMRAVVSFDVEWSGVIDRAHVNNPLRTLAGRFIYNHAQMEWSATVGNYHFMSARLSSSSSDFAELARERNGRFYMAE
jgi:hypothetical protein